MPHQQVIVRLPIQHALHNPAIISMRKRQPLSVKFQLPQSREKPDPQCPGIALKTSSVPIVVSPHQGRGQARQFIQYPLAPNVPAMNVELRPVAAQQLHSRHRGLDAIVRVAQNAHQHGTKTNFPTPPGKPPRDR